MDAIYTLMSALKGQERQMSAVSNNLANVNTNGFKGDQVVFKEFYQASMGQDLESEEERFAHNEFLSPLSRSGTSFAVADHVAPDLSKGKFAHTGNQLDLAIQSDGFFEVETLHGPRYTRDGKFLRDSEGFLINNQGDKILGQKGPIKIMGDEVTIVQDGTVLVDQKEVDRLRIVGFQEPDRMTKLGKSYWAPASDRQKAFDIDDPHVQQGMIEKSNVDTVSEMVKMIAVNRSYEASQKLLTAIDKVDEQSISIARV